MKFKYIAIIVGIVVIAFLPGIKGDWLWDDYIHIVQNYHLRQTVDLKSTFYQSYWTKTTLKKKSSYYRPISTIINYINARVTGINRIGFHIFNILLHIIMTLSVYHFLRLFFSDRISLISSLIYALHPVNSESVLFVSARVDQLGAIFCLWALYLFLKQKNGKYLKITLLFILAILTKENFIIFPLLLLLISLIRKDKNGVIFSLVLGFISIFRILLLHYIVPGIESPGEFIEHSLFTTYWLKKMLFVVGTYTRLLVIPFPLSFLWGEELFIGWLHPFMLLAYTGIAILLFFVFYCFKTKNFILILALFIFICFVIPVLPIFNLAYTVAEHNLYFSSISIALTVAFFLKTQRLKQYLVLIILLIFATADFSRAITFQSAEKVYKASIKYHPDSGKAHSLLATYYMMQDEYDSAIPYLKKAIELDPLNPVNYGNLGNAYLFDGAPDSAVSYLTAALSTHKIYPLQFFNLYLAYKMLNKPASAQKAMTLFKKLAAGDSSKLIDQKFYYELGQTDMYISMGNLKKAKSFLTILQHYPLSPIQRIRISLRKYQLFLKQKDFDSAEQILNKSIIPNIHLIESDLRLFKEYKKFVSPLPAHKN